MKKFIILFIGMLTIGGCYVRTPTVGTSAPIVMELEPLGPSGKCVTGSRFKVDCNWCTCPKSGLKQDALCTKINCLSTTVAPAPNPPHCEGDR